MASAVCSSSRIAVHARPIREMREAPRDEQPRGRRTRAPGSRSAAGRGTRTPRCAASVMPRIPLGPPTSGTSQGLAHEHRHHLAEAERHEREVVAAQTQHRGADQHARPRGDQHHDRDRDVEVQVDRVAGSARPHKRVEGRAGEQRERVGAEREEEHVAQVEQARVPDDDVQADARAARTPSRCRAPPRSRRRAAAGGDQQGDERHADDRTEGLIAGPLRSCRRSTARRPADPRRRTARSAG